MNKKHMDMVLIPLAIFALTFAILYKNQEIHKEQKTGENPLSNFVMK